MVKLLTLAKEDLASSIYALGQQTRKNVSGEHMVALRGPEPANAWRATIIPALSELLGPNHLATNLARAEHASLKLVAGELQSAVHDLRSTLVAADLPADDPRSARLTLNLAHGLAATGDTDAMHEALLLFERYEPLGPIPYDSWCGVVDSVAWICSQLGLWSRGARLPGQHLMAYDCLPWFHLLEGDLDTAERLWREIAEEQPWQTSETNLGIAWRCIAEGRYDEAQRLLGELDRQRPEVEVGLRACAERNDAARPDATQVIAARLSGSTFSMVPDILAILWHEAPFEPTLLQQLCSTDTTPQRLRDALITDLVKASPRDPEAHRLRLAAANNGTALATALQEIPRIVDNDFWQPLVRPLERALELLTGGNLRSFGDVNPERLALASELLDLCPSATNTPGGRHVRALQQRWDEVLASLEEELANEDLENYRRALLRAQRHVALGHVDGLGQVNEQRERTRENLEYLARLTSGMRDVRLRDAILPAFAPWVWDWDWDWGGGCMRYVPMALLTELRPLISRRNFFRMRMNAQPSLRDIMTVCERHAARTTFGGKLYLSPGLRFDSVTTVLTDETVAAFAETADELRRVDGDLLHAWWD